MRIGENIADKDIALDRGEPLFQRILAIQARDRDVWVDAFLGLEEPPADATDLPRGCVPYLPAGAEEILTMVREAPVLPADRFVDLGSGVGRVVLLTHLLTGAYAQGIEIQEPLVQIANGRREKLQLMNVSFLHANVADTSLDGSVFFLYAPFNGSMMEAAVARLEEVVARRSIIVCAVGLEFDLPWLTERKSSLPSLMFYDSSLPKG